MKWRALLAGWCLLVPGAASGEVLLQEVVQAGRFVFHRDSGDRHGYYYVPDEPRLAVGRDGRPQFTFIKYTRAGSEAAGRGGLVHFLVTWGFTDTQLRDAERALRGVDREARIVGPVPFREGRFAVVSASAGVDGVFTRKVVGEGKAPLLPGQKAAVSVALTPEGATVLWEAFQRPTSDVSVVFLLTYSGLTPAYAATLSVDWDAVYRQKDISAGVSGQYGVLRGEADVRAIYDDLRRTGAVRLEVTGTSAPAEALLQIAYEHLVRQLFEPTLGEPSAPPLARTRWWDHALAFVVRAWTTPQALAYRGLAGSARRPTQPTVDWNAFAAEPFEVPPRSAWVAWESEARQRVERAMATLKVDVIAGRELLREFYERYIPGAAADVDRLARTLFDMGVVSEQLGDYRAAVLHYTLSLAYVAGDESLRTYLRATMAQLVRGVAADQLPAPVRTLLELGVKDEPRLRAIGQLLVAMRRSYRSGDYDNVILLSQAPGAALVPLSEFSLWTARAYDRRGDAVRALEAYRESARRRRIELEGPLAAVARRIEVLEAQLSAGRPASPSGAPGVTGQAPQKPTSPPVAGVSPPPSSVPLLEELARQQPAARGSQRRVEPEPGAEGAAPGGAAPSAGALPPSSATRAADAERTDPASRPTPPSSSTPTSSTAAARRPASDIPSALNLRVSYVYRRVRQQGRYQVDLRQRLREDREMTMAGNIGGFVRGDSARFLTEVNLDDPFFTDRRVEVVLDGQDHSDLRSHVNGVSVQLRRRHRDGQATEGDVRFFAAQFADGGNRQTWVYPRLGDGTDWLRYEYRPVWEFYGGTRWEGSWTATESSVIQVASPARPRTIRVAVDEELIRDKGVAAITVQFRHELFGRVASREVVLDYAAGDPLFAHHRYVSESDATSYEVRVVWALRNGTEVVQDWTRRTSAYLQLAFPGRE